MIAFRIDSNAAVRHTARLERLHRSALPVAVRGTLNKAAFDVKQNTMPQNAKNKFEQRAPNFFKANSKVKTATGLSISSMKAEIGFVSKGGNDKSVDDIKQQEDGGSIMGRSFVALKQARSGSSWKRRVKSDSRISNIKGKMIDPLDAGPKNNSNTGQAFVKSAVFAGKGGIIRGTGSNRDIVYKIKSLKRIKGNTIVKLVPLYSIEKGRAVRPKATHFMREASMTSAGKMTKYYELEAQKQIARLR